jgi:hypothetical protein
MPTIRSSPKTLDLALPQGRAQVQNVDLMQMQR